MRSIARQLTLFTLLFLSLGLFAAGFGVYFGVRTMMAREFDQAIESEARVLATLVDFDIDHVEFDYIPGMMPKYAGDQRTGFFQIWTEWTKPNTGIESVWEVSSSAECNFDNQSLAKGKTRSWNTFLPDGRKGRAFAFSFLVRPEAGTELDDVDEDGRALIESDIMIEDAVGQITVAVSREALDHAIASVRIWLLAMGAVLVVLIPVIVVLSVRVGLRPLRRMNTQIEQIDEHSLDSRLSMDKLPVELVASATRMNELLGRLGDAFAKEKRFTAGAAHELRTPLAEIRTIAKVAARQDAISDESHQAFDTIIDASVEMQTLVAQLLQIARGEQATGLDKAQKIDLKVLTQGCVDRYRADADARGVSFELCGEDEYSIRTDRALLAAIIDNLISNVARHAQPRSQASVFFERDAEGLVIVVRNMTSGLDQIAVSQMFEPFWRGDASRASRGFGMGLSVAQMLCSRVGATIQTEFDEKQQTLGVRVHIGQMHTSP